MKSFLDIALSRRSIRSFAPGKIDRHALELCVRAAQHAPSACNSQPWKFVIIDDADKVSSVGDACLSGLYAMNSFAAGAAAFIAIISENSRIPSRVGGWLRGTDFSKIDIGIACSHIVMQAESSGISCCILGWFDEKALKKILRVPHRRKVELLLAMGYAGKHPEHPKNIKPSGETLGINKY